MALGRLIAMHVAAANPLAVDAAGLDPAVVEREKDVLADKFRQQGKPENVIEKIVESGLKTFYKEQTLLEQPFIFDDKKSVAQALKEAEGKVGGADQGHRLRALSRSAKVSRSRKPISPPKSRPPPVRADAHRRSEEGEQNGRARLPPRHRQDLRRGAGGLDAVSASTIRRSTSWSRDLVACHKLGDRARRRRRRRQSASRLAGAMR